MNFKVSQLKSLTAGEVAVDDLIYVIDSNPTDGSVKSKKVTVGDLIDSRIYGISSSQFVLITGYYADPSWITSLDWSKITNAPSFVTSLSALTDVSLSSPVPNQLLRYNGTSWYNWTPTYYSLPAGGTTLQYIDGTGALQTLPTTLPTSTVKHLVKAGVPITKGQAVYVTSADGTNMIVGLASNASESTSSKTMGLLDATVTTNGFANVVTEGLLAGLDTTGANAAGDPVWLGTGGNLIYGLVNKPYAPNHLVFIGIVTRRNANNGEIFVKVQNGFELSEIHDVDARNPDNNDGIFYNSTTQLWEHKQISSVFPTPTLAGVTTAGNTTTNGIALGSTSFVNMMYGEVPKFYVNGGTFLNGSIQLGTNNIRVSGNNITWEGTGITGNLPEWRADATGIKFGNYSSLPLRISVNGTENARFFSTGNVTINSSTDSGFKLDVNGTGRYSSTLTIQTAASDASPSNSILISTSSSGNGGRISWGDSNTSILRYSNSLYFREYTGNFVFESTGSGGVMFSVRPAGTTVSVGNFVTSASITAASAIARGVYFNNTLVAAANNDVLVGLDINPTFTNGAFTGVSNYAIRLQNSGLALFDASIYSQAGSNAFNTTFSITGTAGSDYTIYSSRNFIFNTGQSMYFNTDTDGGSAADRAWYFAGARTGTTGGRTYAAITIDGSGFPSLTIYNNDNGGRIQLNSNAASYFNGGNLLVGTTTDAGYKLDVNGTGRFTNNLSIAKSYNVTWGTNQQINITDYPSYFSSGYNVMSFISSSSGSVAEDGSFVWRNAGTSTNLMILNGLGRLGLGTSNPTYKLEVFGGIRSAFVTTTAVHGEGNTLLLLSGLNGTNPGVNDARLHIGYNQNDPELRLNSGGIAVSTGKWTFLPQIWFAGGITSSHNIALTIDGMSNGVTSSVASEIIRFTQRGGQFANFYDAGAGLSEFRIWQQANSSNYIYLKPGQTSYFSSGNLVIGGTTDAGYKLDVNGTIRFQDHLIFSSTKGIYASTALSTVLQSSTNYFTHNRIGSSGTLGFQISVVGNVQSFWRYNDGTGDVEFGNANGSYHLGLYAGNTERVKILGNGNVGIGTTSPTAKVHVVGSGSTSATNALLIQNSAGTAALTVGDDRNTIVNGQFDVTGTSNFRVVTTTSSVKLQIGASPWMTYDATSTYFLGTDFYANAGNKNFRWGGGAVFGAVINRNGSAIVQLESTTQGFLPPRMTTAQRTAISSPAAGLCVFDTDLQNLCFFRDGVWVQVSFAAI